MRIQESERDRQAYLTRRMSEADIATREYMSKHAHEIGLAEGRIEKIHLAQRYLKQPLTDKETLERMTLNELSALADQLERQVLPPSEVP